MKILIITLVALLPLHALLVTTLKCKFWLDTNILRFWKEIILAVLFIATFFQTMRPKRSPIGGKKYNWNFSKLYKNNYLLWMITLFSLFSFAFIFLPFLQPKLASYLGFKYDVFFLIALVIWLYLNIVRENLNTILKTVFISSWFILSIFTPWYLFWDISAVTSIFWFSSEVSTYTANSCISFSQNVEWQHRFQWSFAWPIRWSVFLTVFYVIYLWFILHNFRKSKKSIFYSLLIIPSIFIIISIFFSYSKTTILWLIFWISVFSYLTYKIKFNKKISKKIITVVSVIPALALISVALLKKDLFLHLGSVINRFDNIITSIEMFIYNPFGYWLWIAWPASWTWNSIESAWNWQIAVASSWSTHKFLPENWFLQILLEQWLIWLSIFLSLMLIIWLKLLDIVKNKKDYLSIWIFTSYVSIIFMANFTHAFEESATSYILFLIIWAYIAKYWKIKKK